MIIDVRAADVVTVYRALVGLVVPRPIAWVTTVDPAGRVNLAPFSFFNAFGANPPIVVFSPTLRRDGSKKDTLLNVEAVGEFVVNAAVEELAEKMNSTSAELPRGESEANLRRLDAGALRQGSPASRGRIARSPGMPRQVNHVDGRWSDRRESGDRRGRLDPHRRARAGFCWTGRPAQAAGHRSPGRQRLLSDGRSLSDGTAVIS